MIYGPGSASDWLEWTTRLVVHYFGYQAAVLNGLVDGCIRVLLAPFHPRQAWHDMFVGFRKVFSLWRVAACRAAEERGWALQTAAALAAFAERAAAVTAVPGHVMEEQPAVQQALTALAAFTERPAAVERSTAACGPPWQVGSRAVVSRHAPAFRLWRAEMSVCTAALPAWPDPRVCRWTPLSARLKACASSYRYSISGGRPMVFKGIDMGLDAPTPPSWLP